MAVCDCLVMRGFPSDARVLGGLDLTFYPQSIEEPVEEQMAANGTAMLLNLDLGIVGEGEFGIEMKDGVKVFNIEHCTRMLLG